MIMTVLRRRVLVAVASLTALSAVTPVVAPTAQADPSWGAIAAASNGAWGRSWNAPSSAQADQGALAGCGYSSCQVMIDYTDCGALADNGQAFRARTGPTASAAMRAALSLPGSSIVTWGCE